MVSLPGVQGQPSAILPSQFRSAWAAHSSVALDAPGLYDGLFARYSASVQSAVAAGTTCPFTHWCCASAHTPFWLPQYGTWSTRR